MANILPRQKQVAVLNALVEGVSIRSTERMLDVSRETVLSLLVRVGEGCAELHDKMMRDLPCERIECDEIWGFIQKKQRNLNPTDDAGQVGDAWTFVGIDADSKLIPAYQVGKREAYNTRAFVADLASRMRNKVQISTDGLGFYIAAIESAFGVDVDYARVVKSYEAEATGPGRYSLRKSAPCKKIPSSATPICAPPPRPTSSGRTSRCAWASAA